MQIDSVAQLAALIRRQMGSARLPGRATSSAGQLRSDKSTELGESAHGEDVADVIARRVRALDPDDPDREQKAFRVLLESVLLAELGTQLVNDVGFYELVEQVHRRMEADPELASAIREVAGRLIPSEPRR